ncbi:hypothetical protein [Pseudobacillus wudalianchiensis]|nr:hypothetical protein [Bacillus wudalianchiensis]
MNKIEIREMYVQTYDLLDSEYGVAVDSFRVFYEENGSELIKSKELNGYEIPKVDFFRYE